MPRKRNTAEQIITNLRQAEVEVARGQPIAEVCRKLGTSEQTYPGFPIWPWYSTARTSRRALISGAPT